MTATVKSFDLSDNPTTIASVIDEFYPIPSTANIRFAGYKCGNTGFVVMIQDS